MVENDFVNFDIIGSRFRLKKDLLKKFPLSLFNDLSQYSNDRDHNIRLPEDVVKVQSSNEFYVQRSPDFFKIVLQFMISGQLHVPSNVCKDQLLDEFLFWKIQPNAICKKCSSCYSNGDKYEIYDNVIVDTSNKTASIRRKLWTFIEQPSSSLLALIYAILSLVFISISILNIVFTSMPELQFCPKVVAAGNNSTNHEQETSHMKQDLDENIMFTDCNGTNIILIIDMVCIGWFTFELILRLIACQSLKQFFTCPLNIIDMLAILPFYIELILYLANSDKKEMYAARAILMFLRLLRIIRIFRIFKLARYVSSLRILGSAIRSAVKELNMLFLFIIMATFICANFLYQLEKNESDTAFTSIPASFWWCIVTLTTVGYGDMVPQTILGKLFGSFTCICGIIVVAFPVAILVEKFIVVYKKHEQKPQYFVENVPYHAEKMVKDNSPA